MKKPLNYSAFFTAGTGILGALLRQWHLSAGVDHQGLYPAAHPGWIGYLVLTAATLAALWLATREPGEDPTWKRNFPHHLSGDNTPRFYLDFAKAAFRASGYALAAVGIGVYMHSLLPGSGMLYTAVYWGGWVCAAALLLLSVQLFSGKPPVAMAHLIICVYFAILLFTTGRQFSGEPELVRFLPQLFALAASALAAYQLWGFAVGCGNRRKSLFWSLSAAFLCLAAAPGAHVMYAALGLWHLGSHCVLTLPPEETPEDASQEIPEEATTEPTDE